MLVLVLARICSADPRPHRPHYDHQHRDYYVIRISDPSLQLQELLDHYPNNQPPHHPHHVLGELLGLRFESRVGSLPDYLLYSSLKPLSPPHHHHHPGLDHSTNRTETLPEESSSSPTSFQKRSLDNFHQSSSLEQSVQDATLGSLDTINDNHDDNDDDDDDDASDPVVQRFFHLKKRHEHTPLLPQYAKKKKTKRELPFLFDDDHPSGCTQEEEDDLLAQLSRSSIGMRDIQKQRLRQRVKKRAPLLEPMVVPVKSVVSRKERKGKKKEKQEEEEEGGGEDVADETELDKEQEQEDAEVEAELESDQEEQDLEEGGGEDKEGGKDEDGEDEQEGKGGEGEGEDEEGGKDEDGKDEQGEGGEGGGGGEVEEEMSENESESDDSKIEYQPEGESQPDDGLAETLGIEDPGFQYQWYLHNTKDRHDINVTGVWEQGIIGTGVNVAIIDDGLDMTSEDLAPNFFKEGSWDFNDNTALPMPRLIDDQHGTRCAGEIAAAKNDLCGLGVAYGAKVAGLRILSGQITDVDEATALNYRFQENHIYSCSWGPPDDGRSMDGPKGVVLDAMVNGIKNGRGGLGSIYVFATGNGGSREDDCNFDGYTNSLYTVSIGAIDRLGKHPYYSEACSAQLAVTYSNGGGSAI
ncbi:pheromone processing endoprotease, partial [Podila verticillata]